MSKVLVTGANGHIGSNVARACLAAGHEVIALVRERSDRRALAGLDVEVRVGDVLDRESLRAALEGVERVFHLAAPHKNFAGDARALIEPSVAGTRNVIGAAREAGVKRVIHTSSGAAVGFAEDPSRPLDERSFFHGAKSAYTRAKIEGEEVALEEARRGGIEVVVVNPSGVFGPHDHRITPATASLIGLLKGDPAFLHVCVTDVRDVAAGQLLAAERGRSGERYLLTGEQLSPERLGELLHRLAGVRPKATLPPKALLMILAALQELKARVTGRDAPITRGLVADVHGRHLAYDSTRSREELGLRYRSAEETLKDAVRWLLFVKALPEAAARRAKAALGEEAAPDPSWRR